MKKNKLWGFASILAAGALLFGAMGCDTGAGEDDPLKGYNPEIPTTYYSYTTTGNDTTVDAVWDFETDLVVDLNGSDVVIANTAGLLDDDGNVKPTSGSGATLTPNDSIKGHSKDGFYDETKTVAFAVAADNSSSLSNYTKFKFTLALEKQSNIYIDACGGGSATAARYIAIVDANDAPIVYKDNLASKKPVLFQVQGAPAGTYTVYVAGSCIRTIKVQDGEVTKPAEIGKLVLYQDDEKAPDTIDSFEAYETVKFTAVNIISDTENEDITADVTWTSSNESVATVKDGVVTGVAAGTAIIRARSGRFSDQRTVKVDASTKTMVTLISADSLPTAKTKITDWTADAAKALLTPTVVGGFATASEAATIEFVDSAALPLTDDGIYAMPKHASEDAATKWGLSWKDNLSAAPTDSLTEATITLKVTPVGTKKIIGISIASANGKGAGSVSVKATVGSSSVEAKSVSGKNYEVASADFGTPVEISEETTVTFEVINNKKYGMSVSLQDITLILSE